MNLWMKRCLEAGVIVGGLWVLGSGLACAQDLNHGAPSVLNAPVTAPVTVSGNAVAVLGHSRATSTTAGTSSTPAATPARHRSPISAPVTAPVTVCGNAVGRASASCGAAGSGSTSSSGNRSGAVIDAPASAPVTVCGNAAGLLGNASATCSAAGASTGGTGSTGSSAGSGSSTGGISAPVSTPVTVCGNSVGLLGSASANCSGTGSTPPVTGGSSGPGTPTQTVIGQSVEGASADRQLDKGALSLTGKPVSARSLAFTGSSLVMLEWLAVTLLLAGLALTVGWRRRTA